MSRVLVPSETIWYHELNSVGYYGETELEREIRQHVRSLFPDFYVFPFKKTVTSLKTGQVNAPDLAMIRRDFAAWGIIEVELAHHDIRHVITQTTCFAEGKYNVPEIADYIREQMAKHCEKRPSLARIKTLIDNHLPSVLVIADEHSASWQQKLRALGIQLCMFQIFKSTHGRFVYRTLGDYPAVPVSEAYCRPHASLSNTLEIVGSFEFKKLGKKKQVDVVFDATLTRWALIDDSGKNYLRFLGKENPLSANSTYTLFSDSRHKYYFRIN